MSTGRKLRALVGVVATLLLAAGCGAAGLHPGAAAVVGGTEISIRDVENTSRAVSAALGKDFNSQTTVSELVNNALVTQVGDEQTIEVTNAEVAEAAKLVVGDEATYQKFQANPVTADFLDQVAKAAVTTIKLGGGTGVNDPDLTAKQQAGLAKVKEASKDINISVAPRFGQWSDGSVDTTISGSLSQESAQAKARREQAQNAQQGQG